MTPAEQRREWLRGYAAALAAIQRSFGQSSMVVSILVGDGVTVEELREARVGAFDLKPILRATMGTDAASVAARGGRS